MSAFQRYKKMVVIDEGQGSFVFNDHAAGPRGSLRVFYFRPRSAHADTPILIAMHGGDRAASDFRDSLSKNAERLGFLVVVPEFDREAFPDAHSYNYGNVKLAPPDSQVLPRDQWNFDLVERLFYQVRAASGSPHETFGLFGLSAGAQYVLRYLALTEAPFVDMAVVANCGWYMLPTFDLDYPDGMAGLGLDENILRRYFGRNVLMLLGDADIDPSAADLPRNEVATVQGPHRLARGLWHFDHCKRTAEQLGIGFGWHLEIVPGAGHVDQVMYDTAVERLTLTRTRSPY
jgi:predicted alpha/beta-fold hydrolase